MTGQDFQDKLDAIVGELQTKGKGQIVQIMFRNGNNAPDVLPLSSDANGVVNAAQLTAVQDFITPLQGIADEYSNAFAPVQAANEAFRTAQIPHQALIDAARTSRETLNAALMSDTNYQTAKTALDAARQNPNYVEFFESYKAQNVSENYAELQRAKGAYTV